jgi:acetylornithine/succinyldiaminopimelate/putrescine aminotransferase
MKSIPISAAKQIADLYDYHQVIIIGRAVGEGEHVTTYGKNPAHCAIAAKCGDFLKYAIMKWAKA